MRKFLSNKWVKRIFKVKYYTFRILFLTLILGSLFYRIELHESFLYNHVGDSVVKLTIEFEDRHGVKRGGGGTGFITEVNGKQIILTNKHVCEIAEMPEADGEMDVISWDENRKAKTKIIKKYEDHDLCAMEAPEGYKSIRIANSIWRHEKVHLIGYPALRPLSLESGFFAGPMEIELCKEPSGMYGCAKIEKVKTNYINLVSYGGNSGSPVVDNYGQVIGVLFAGSPQQNTDTHMVPFFHIKKFIKQLQKVIK